MKKRILTISDIHGHYEQLVKLLELANYNPQDDQLVILGDIVDRGPENMKTLFYVRQLVKDGAVAIMGNHDKTAYLSFKEIIDMGYGSDTQLHVNCLNGYETHVEFMKLSDADKKIARNFLGGLPLYYEYEEYIFVHSGVSSDRPIEENDEAVLLWSREEFYEYPAYGGKTVVFGHTPTKYLNLYGENRIWTDKVHEDKIGIDCGCFFSGTLGCLEIDIETGAIDAHYVKR